MKRKKAKEAFAAMEKAEPAQEEKATDCRYGSILQYASDVLAIVVTCFLVGICYWQWRVPPVYTQYMQDGTQSSLEQPLAVDVKNNGLFASMTIAVCDYENLKEAKLLINGKLPVLFNKSNW